MITIGLLFTEKKWKRLNDVKMFKSFEEMGIHYYRINTQLPLSAQLPVHAIFHKYIDQMEVEGDENEAIVKWVQAALLHDPNLKFIDSLDNLRDFLRRSYSYEVAEKAIACSKLEHILSVPDYFLLPKGTSIKEALTNHNVQLPILVKPQWTVGNPESHIIDIFIDEQALPSHYDMDMVVQSYKDHNGVIYKVYAIGEQVCIETRYSLPNVDQCENPIKKFQINREKKCPQSFNSDDTSPTHNNEPILNDFAATYHFNMDMVKSFVSHVEKILGKDLIGVDFIIDSNDASKVYCIDINLFPSYSGFDNVSEVMARWILQKCAV